MLSDHKVVQCCQYEAAKWNHVIICWPLLSGVLAVGLLEDCVRAAVSHDVRECVD